MAPSAICSPRIILAYCYTPANTCSGACVAAETGEVAPLKEKWESESELVSPRSLLGGCILFEPTYIQRKLHGAGNKELLLLARYIRLP